MSISTTYEYKKTVGQFSIWLEDEHYQQIDNTLEYEKLENDLKLLNKYIKYPTEIYIKLDKEGTEWAGLAKYVKPKRFKTDEPSVEPHYEIYISTETLQSLTHEICHVIDKVAAKDQYSNKSQFKPLFNLYKRAQKEKIRDIKQSDMPKNIKANHIAYWKHPYRNGPSEIFARFCESYLKEREELVYTNVKGLTTFDSLCTDYIWKMNTK